MSEINSFLNNKSEKEVGIKCGDGNEKRRIYKNLFALAIAFVLLFTAFLSIANLQSSINEEDGLGVYSLASIYIALSLSSLFFPTIIIQKLGCKKTIFFSMFGYSTYTLAQFYPSFLTLIPAGFIIGVAAGSLWAAQSVYITKIGEAFADLVNISSQTILQRFFGLFFLVFHTSQIWGNWISAALMEKTPDDAGNVGVNTCGSFHCPLVKASFNSTPPTSSAKPERQTINLIIGIFLLFSLGASLITWLFVDSLERYGECKSNKRNAKQLIRATFNQMKDLKQILLIPLTIWLGFQAGFIGGDFNLGYVACAWGVKYIGYSMIVFGICDGVSSFIFGRLTKHMGRPAVFGFAGCVSMTCLVLLLLWRPEEDNQPPRIFLAIAAMWGVADGIWIPQINALYGTIFKDSKEAAFSTSRFWSAIGCIIAYLNSTMFCMTFKIYFCMGLVTIALFFYFLLEVLVKLELKNSKIVRPIVT